MGLKGHLVMLHGMITSDKMLPLAEEITPRMGCRRALRGHLSIREVAGLGLNEQGPELRL